MRDEPFPMCCGAAVFSDFGNTQTSGRQKGPIPLEEIDSWLSRYVANYAHYALLFATLNGDQEEAGIGKVLRSHGFRKHASGYNQGHKTDVFAYIKTNKRPDMKPSMPKPPVGETIGSGLTIPLATRVQMEDQTLLVEWAREVQTEPVMTPYQQWLAAR